MLTDDQRLEGAKALFKAEHDRVVIPQLSVTYPNIELEDGLSIQETDDQLSIIIEGRLPRQKEALLLAWLVLWIGLGGYVMYELATGTYERELRLALKVYLALWAYFLFKIGRAFLWSRAGQERIILTEGQLSLKKSIYGYGKSEAYAVENIKDMKVSEMSKQSFQYQIESSFWVIGGERIDFEHINRRYRFGRKIDDKHAKSIVQKMRKRIKEFKRKSATE